MINELVKNLNKGEVTAVCGRPGMGQIDLVLNIALKIMEDGGSVLLVCVNEGLCELRSLCSIISGVDQYEILHGCKSDENDKKVRQAIEKLWTFRESGKLDLIRGNSDVQMISSIFPSITRFTDVDVVVYSHDAIFKCDGYNMEEEAVLSGLKARSQYLAMKKLAVERDVAVVYPTVLSRKIEYRKNRRPRFADIMYYRKAGHYLDKILLLYRKGYYDFRDYEAAPNGNEKLYIYTANKNDMAFTKSTAYYNNYNNRISDTYE